MPAKNKSFGSLNPYLVLGVATALLHIAIAAWRAQGSYFFGDDFLQLGLARDTDLSLSHLVRDMFGHIEPLTMLTHWLFIRAAGWDFVAAQITLVTASTIGVVMMTATASRARTPLIIAIGCVLAAALTWVTIQPTRWWVSGVIVLPATVLGVAALWICAKPARQLELRDRIALAFVLVAALAFYNKAILVIALCGAVRLFVAQSGRSSQGFWPDVLAALRDLAPAITLVGFAILAILIRKASIGDGPAGPTMSVVSGIGVGLQYGWLGGLSGLRVSVETPLIAQIAAAIIATGLFVLVLYASLRRNSAAIWIWLALIGIVFVGIVLISLERSTPFGPWIMASGRYHTDTVFLTLAAILIVFGQAYQGEQKETSARRPWIALSAAGAVAVFQFAGGIAYPHMADTAPPRLFVETLRQQAEQLPAGSILGDRPLPESVAPRWMQPWNDLSPLMANIAPEVAVSSWDQAAYYADDAGHMHAFADLPRQTFQAPDGSMLTLSMAAPIAHMGYFESTYDDRLAGWFNPLLTPAQTLQIAIVARGRIIDWATPEERPDVAAFYNRGTMSSAGFTAPISQGYPRGELNAVAIIDGRIGIVLPIAN